MFTVDEDFFHFFEVIVCFQVVIGVFMLNIFFIQDFLRVLVVVFLIDYRGIDCVINWMKFCCPKLKIINQDGLNWIMRYVRFDEVVNLSSCLRGFFIFIIFIVPVCNRVQPIIVRVILE